VQQISGTGKAQTAELPLSARFLALTPQRQLGLCVLELTRRFANYKRHVLRRRNFLKGIAQQSLQRLLGSERFTVFTETAQPVLLRRELFQPGVR